jgi:1,4-alpha-glucan branching enzyme
VCNFTPVERRDVRIGVAGPGFWSEVMNTDAAIYGGGNRGNLGGKPAERISSQGRDWSIEITLPPLSTLFFKLDQ